MTGISSAVEYTVRDREAAVQFCHPRQSFPTPEVKLGFCWYYNRGVEDYFISLS